MSAPSWWPWVRRRPAPGYRVLPGDPALSAYPDDLAGDLRRHLYASLYAVKPSVRELSQWVMNTEWWVEVRELGDPTPGTLPLPHPQPPVLLGLPVVVRDGAGVPHLELRP